MDPQVTVNTEFTFRAIENAIELFDEIFYEIAPINSYNEANKGEGIKIPFKLLSDQQCHVIKELSGHLCSARRSLVLRRESEVSPAAIQAANVRSTSSTDVNNNTIVGQQMSMLRDYLVSELIRSEAAELALKAKEDELVFITAENEKLNKKIANMSNNMSFINTTSFTATSNVAKVSASASAAPQAVEPKSFHANSRASSDRIDTHPASYVHMYVRKQFGNSYFFGLITTYDPNEQFFQIVYEDADYEDLTHSELRRVLWTGATPNAKREVCMKHAKLLGHITESVHASLSESLKSTSSSSKSGGSSSGDGKSVNESVSGYFSSSSSSSINNNGVDSSSNNVDSTIGAEPTTIRSNTSNTASDPLRSTPAPVFIPTHSNTIPATTATTLTNNHASVPSLSSLTIASAIPHKRPLPTVSEASSASDFDNDDSRDFSPAPTTTYTTTLNGTNNNHTTSINNIIKQPSDSTLDVARTNISTLSPTALPHSTTTIAASASSSSKISSGRVKMGKKSSPSAVTTLTAPASQAQAQSQAQVQLLTESKIVLLRQMCQGSVPPPPQALSAVSSSAKDPPPAKSGLKRDTSQPQLQQLGEGTAASTTGPAASAVTSATATATVTGATNSSPRPPVTGASSSSSSLQQRTLTHHFGPAQTSAPKATTAATTAATTKTPQTHTSTAGSTAGSTTTTTNSVHSVHSNHSNHSTSSSSAHKQAASTHAGRSASPSVSLPATGPDGVTFLHCASSGSTANPANTGSGSASGGNGSGNGVVGSGITPVATISRENSSNSSNSQTHPTTNNTGGNSSTTTHPPLPPHNQHKRSSESEIFDSSSSSTKKRFKSEADEVVIIPSKPKAPEVIEIE